MRPLRVMTLNIWNDDGPWPERSKLIREQISVHDPDLIGFQEVLRGEDLDLLEELLGGTEYHGDFVKATSDWPRLEVELGNAIASKWPIIARQELVLPIAEGHAGRAALIGTIDSPIGEITFATTHLSWRMDQGHIRERQVAVIAEYLDYPLMGDSFPPIIVGDFNTTSDSTEIRFLTGKHSFGGRSFFLRDAWAHAGDGTEGLTWTAENPYIPRWLEPERRVDYIFVGLPTKAGLGDVLSCRLVCNQSVNGVWPSDHFGLLAELRAEPFPQTEVD
jgi:endonuclease/exonuclease/phosphatase family metal-dependent hydrolase